MKYQPCQQFTDLVTIWLADRAGMLGEIERHRAECATCRANMRAARAWIAEHPAADVPNWLTIGADGEPVNVAL